MDEDHASFPMGFPHPFATQPVGYGIRAKRLAPQKHARRHDGLTHPGPDHGDHTRVRHRVALIDDVDRNEFNREKYRVAQCQQQEASNRQCERSRQCPGNPDNARKHPNCNQKFLKESQHETGP